MPKMKTKSSKKDFPSLEAEKLKKARFKSHILTKKATTRKRNLTKSGLVHDATPNIKIQLCK